MPSLICVIHTGLHRSPPVHCSILMVATQLQRVSENFLRTVCSEHFSMPAIKMHISLAQHLNCDSLQFVLSLSSSVQWPCSLLMILFAKNMALAASSEGLCMSILCSIKGSSIRYRARFQSCSSAFATLAKRQRNLYGEGVVMLNQSVVKIDISIRRISSRV